MDDFAHCYEMESLSLGITARKDVLEQLRRLGGGNHAELAAGGLFRTAQALAAREAEEAKGDDDAEEPQWRIVLAGNSKECFRNRFRNIQLVALSSAIVKSRLTGIYALEFPFNYLGEDQDEVELEHPDSENAMNALNERPYLLEAAPAIARLLQNTAVYTSTIAEIDLNGNHFGAESCQLLCSSLMEAPTSLRRLSLRGNRLRVAGGHAIAALLASSVCSLQDLDVGNTELEVENLIAIASALRTNRSLHTLNLDNPVVRTMEEEAIQHIGKMLQVNETLTSLSLCKHQLTDYGAQVLAEHLLDNQTLQRLVLRANQIGSTGASAIAALLMRHDGLSELDLSANRIGDVGAAAFAKVLRHNTRPLTTLSLTSTYLTDDGLAAIAEACLQPRHPQVQRLTTLLLWGNDFDSRSNALFLELHDSRFAEFDVETDFVPSHGDHGVQMAHRETQRAKAFASPKR
ncbi:hypothetical protein Poli38472_005118 [Pythium oligandrum]|uniref:Uncharacterized protein n=1 Tax=Pythium oligandrum TaxID=41045 RepID=A0A8K1CFZ8_PYTOL|nr:hypothetical protein Poli38472_005118 [Pythium oligandrum]|eukprot:TMW62500.1 hypothetical protein Poli38472_005118 [Pythium oligandrum]